MQASFRLGRIAGIEIGIHYTWLIALVLISWSLAQGYFPQYYPGWDNVTYWVLGVVAALFLFISVLLHEIAHSLVAQARNLRVKGITLFIFGGVSNIEGEPKQAGVEFTMAIAGPLTSLALAGIFWIIQRVSGLRDVPVAAILGYLAFINALLGVFNLLPGFPLDGGRVLRSIIWGATRNLRKSTNIAATVGQFFGWGFVVYGVFQLLTGNILGGIWIALIGWFLAGAADSSRRDVTLQEHMSGIKVRNVMDTSSDTISPDTPVEALVREIFLNHGRRAAPVSRNGILVGIVTLKDIKEVPQQRWSMTPVEEIMTREPLFKVSPDDDLSSAMKMIAEHSLNQVLVVEDGKLVGMLSRANIIRYLQLSQELMIAPGK